MKGTYAADFDGKTVLCPACAGSGTERWYPDDTIPGAGELTEFCRVCGGLGRAKVEDALDFCKWPHQRDQAAAILLSLRHWYQERGLAIPAELLRHHRV